MVGAATSLALAQQGFRVIQIEVHEPQSGFDAAVIDNRVSALTRASQNLLENLGVWSAMQGMRVTPYSDMHVWDAGGKGVIHFDAADIAEPCLGHIVENHVTQLALWQAISAHDNIEIICPDKVVQLKREAGQSVLQLASGGEVRAGLVVAADGRQSAMRDLLGIGTHGWPYDQHALVATVTTAAGHADTAWQRFLPNGPLAYLPLHDNYSSIVWSTTPEQAAELKQLPDDQFCTALTQASETRLGEVTSVQARAIFPLELKHADTYISEGFVLIGDAAHAVHPLAGQGVNLGFLDVASLVDVLLQVRQQGRELGGLHSLRRYERSRKGSNMGMLAAMDGFKRLFGSQLLPVKLARNAGLSIADVFSPLKNFLVSYAMGLQGDLPPLVRPRFHT
jgi:2-octaprenylphenol hydroxylase